jgi:hypothetical protein
MAFPELRAYHKDALLQKQAIGSSLHLCNSADVILVFACPNEDTVAWSNVPSWYPVSCWYQLGLLSLPQETRHPFETKSILPWVIQQVVEVPLRQLSC